MSLWMGLEVKSSLSLSSAFMHNFSVSSSVSLSLSTVSLSKSLFPSTAFFHTQFFSFSLSFHAWFKPVFLSPVCFWSHFLFLWFSVTNMALWSRIKVWFSVKWPSVKSENNALWAMDYCMQNMPGHFTVMHHPTSICPDVDGVKQRK